MKKIFVASLLFLSVAACASITIDDYNAVKKGMSFEKVRETLGKRYWENSCKQDDDSEIEAAGLERYYCVGENGFRSYTVGFTFKNNILIKKYTNGRLD